MEDLFVILYFLGGGLLVLFVSMGYYKDSHRSRRRLTDKQLDELNDPHDKWDREDKEAAEAEKRI